MVLSGLEVLPDDIAEHEAMNLRVPILSILSMLIAAAAPSSAAAQSMIPPDLPIPLGMPLPDEYFLNPAVGAVVEAAFAQPYGRLLVDEFAAVLSESGDPGCVQTKGIEKYKIADRARAILVRKGTHMYEMIAAFIDRPRYAAILAQREGANAGAELARLRTDPVVQQFIAIERSAQLAGVAFNVVYELDTYSLIFRIKLVRYVVFDLKEGDALNRAHLRNETDAKLAALIENNKSQSLTRYSERLVLLCSTTTSIPSISGAKISRRSWMRFIGREPNSAWCSSRQNTRNASGLFMS